jgi:endonuclease/exonuclease/phosphatase family protein
MVHKLVARLTLALFVLFPLAVRAQASDFNNRYRDFSVMTRNMDAGSDFLYILQAVQTDPGNLPALLQATTKTYLEMHMSNIPARADGIAAEIQQKLPLLVGLQEVTLLRTGAYNQPATTVLDDGLASLMASLEKRGLHYAILAQQQNADITVPALDPTLQNLIDVRLTDSDVVLVRTDVTVADFKLGSVTKQHFANFLVLPVAGTGIDITRGWIAVDAKFRGKDFRFVTTHLETFSPDYQQAQTLELISGALNTTLPVILAGDLNSDALHPSFANGPAYGILTADGFTDVWTALQPTEAGATWPLFPEDVPLGGAPTPQRIDLVLVKNGGIQPTAIQETGTTPIITTPEFTLYASDHAGVVAGFNLLP